MLLNLYFLTRLVEVLSFILNRRAINRGLINFANFGLIANCSSSNRQPPHVLPEVRFIKRSFPSFFAFTFASSNEPEKILVVFSFCVHAIKNR